MATQLAASPTESEVLLVTVEEAARMLAIHRSKMFPLMASKQIASLKIGRSRRIPISALREYIEAQVVEQSA